jgi:hypothetical protein
MGETWKSAELVEFWKSLLTHSPKESIMKRSYALMVFVFLFAFAHKALADNVPSYATGYPKTGNNAGGILVKGSTKFDTGWSAQGTAAIFAWPKTGGSMVQKAIGINLKTGNWGNDNCNNWIEVEITGLPAATDCCVIVQVTATDGTNNKICVTMAAIMTSK